MLRHFRRTSDVLDVIGYGTTTHESITSPMIRNDVFGDRFMDFYHGRKDISELLTYLAALFILSDMVRYHADDWKRLLDAHQSEAILAHRFLDIAIRKVPNLILSSLEGEVFLFRVAR